MNKYEPLGLLEEWGIIHELHQAFKLVKDLVKIPVLRPENLHF